MKPLDLDDPPKGTMMENLALEVCLARWGAREAASASAASFPDSPVTAHRSGASVECD